MIKVTKVMAINNSCLNGYDNRQPKVKYYNNKVTKTKVKQDFGIMLDTEIKKLKFDYFV